MTGLKDLKEGIEKGKIVLPNVQRGFVWKPWQIENLWDSLMRRFPVGSFVGVEKDGKTELLDGQQRATAIALAFFEPDGTEDSQNVLRSSTDRVRLFIDLKKGTGTDRKYIFRVITKSHPWGYQKSRNDRTLSAENIRRACEDYKMADKNPYAEPLGKFWPYDASFPVPFGFFLNGDNAATVRSKIERWCERHHQKPFPTGPDYYGIKELLDTVRDVLGNTSLPLLLVSEQVLDAETGLSASDGETDTDADDGDDEIENLFIRLNAGGTPLRGEELNYSILKTNIGIDLQKRIENACAGFMRPARFITIACRLYQNRPEKPTADAVTMRIQPKQFQGIIRNEKAGFIRFVEKLLDADFLGRVKTVLRYDPDDNAFGLPDFIVSELADRAPEVMLMLMHRLLYTDDETKMTEETRRRMLGVVTLLTWFGKGQRDHAPLIGRLWEQVRKTKEADAFWSAGLMRTACEERENETLFPAFPKFNELKKGIKAQKNIRIDSLYRWNFEKVQPFLSRLFYERSLILYAQRDALNLWFKDWRDFDLEDTLCPFDWDHISPENLIYRKRHIHDALKSWYQTNGNFRAWPFTLNRKDQDVVPSEKLLCSKNDFTDILKSIGVTDYPYKSDVLLDWSKCAKAWKEIDFNDLSEKTDSQHKRNKQLINAIINRNLELIRTWYDELRINDLCPSGK